MTLLEKLRIIFRALGWPVFITFFAFYLLFPRNAVAATVEVDGVTFPVSQKAGDAELRLRGAGTLKWAMLVDLYAGAFYLPETAESRDWRGDVGKHLELSYFRKVPAEGFVEASQEHLQERLPPERMNQLQPRLNELYDLFRDVGPGDRYMLTYIPGSGTVLSLNGEPLGTIPGADFAEAYFGIWLGDDPLSEKFRDQVLGLSAS